MAAPGSEHNNIDTLKRALADGRLSDDPGRPGNYEIEITPDDAASAVGLDPAAVDLPVPFH